MRNLEIRNEKKRDWKKNKFKDRKICKQNNLPLALSNPRITYEYM